MKKKKKNIVRYEVTDLEATSHQLTNMGSLVSIMDNRTKEVYQVTLADALEFERFVQIDRLCEALGIYEANRDVASGKIERHENYNGDKHIQIKNLGVYGTYTGDIWVDIDTGNIKSDGVIELHSKYIKELTLSSSSNIQSHVTINLLSLSRVEALTLSSSSDTQNHVTINLPSLSKVNRLNVYEMLRNINVNQKEFRVEGACLINSSYEVLQADTRIIGNPNVYMGVLSLDVYCNEPLTTQGLDYIEVKARVKTIESITTCSKGISKYNSYTKVFLYLDRLILNCIELQKIHYSSGLHSLYVDKVIMNDVTNGEDIVRQAMESCMVSWKNYDIVAKKVLKYLRGYKVPLEVVEKMERTCGFPVFYVDTKTFSANSVFKDANIVTKGSRNYFKLDSYEWLPKLIPSAIENCKLLRDRISETLAIYKRDLI